MAVDVEDKESENNSNKKNGWVVPLITTLIGIVVTLLVAWYQLAASEEQAMEAEVERSKSVKSELIQIVEEHVLNGSPLDITRLTRLAEYRSKQEKLLMTPSVSELVEGAEFNILKSQYLDFERKNNFKLIFDQIYSDLLVGLKQSYSGVFENSVNDLYASVYGGNSNDIFEKLNKVLVDFNGKIEELNSEKLIKENRSIEDFLRIVFDRPEFIVIATGLYVISLYILVLIRRKKRNKLLFEKEIARRYEAKLFGLSQKGSVYPDGD